MPVGPPVSEQGLYAQLSQIVVDIRDALARAHQLKTYLTNTDNTALQAIGITSPDDVFLLRAAAGDLDTFGSVWDGEVPVDPAYNFRTYTDLVTGFQ